MITTLQGRTQKVEISPEGPTVIIGERLNPTGHSRLAEALRKGDWGLIRQEAISQVEQGAAIIDNNFLAMAIWCGVNAPIVNPAAKEMVETILAADLLEAKNTTSQERA